MAVPITVCPEATYATKTNVKFPGTQAQATAAEAEATARVDERFKSTITFTAGAGSVEVAT